MNQVRTLLPRAAVPAADTWDLGSLFADDEAWERAFRRFERRIAGYAEFRGKLAGGAEALAACLKFDSELDRRGERLGTYAFLRTSEDQANSTYQRMHGRYQNAATRAAEAASFIRPEILAIPDKRLKTFLEAREMRPYRLLVERLVRCKPYTLGEKEEALLAMQGEMAGVASQAFRQLLDADLKFGSLKDENRREVELTHATFSQFLHSPRRNVRRAAFHQYYRQFAAHEHTLAAMLHGSIQKDVYYARARGFSSSLAAALFPDDVPQSVYDNLIAVVRRHLPVVHRYYEIRRRKMRLKDLHHYDTYVPILSQLKMHHSWEEAVQRVLGALQPLGNDYCGLLESGLLGRWCDRYPNQGKQSGAFSCGSYDGDPYILMNYKPEVLDDVFTLAHEAGHSMHSYFSARSQPFPYYNYAIFVAEVASTFNEQLLSQRLLAEAGGRRTACLSRQSGNRWNPRDHRPADHVCRVRKDGSRHGGGGGTADGSGFSGCLPPVAAGLFRTRFRPGRRTGLGMPSHPPLLPRFLRLQVRHRPGSSHCAQPACVVRGSPGAARLSAVSPRRLCQIPSRPAPRRRRGHGATPARGDGSDAVRRTSRRTGTSAELTAGTRAAVLRPMQGWT